MRLPDDSAGGYEQEVDIGAWKMQGNRRGRNHGLGGSITSPNQCLGWTENV